MEYLLIVFFIAVVLSPLAWLKSSPGQVRVTAFRRQAMALGLRVQLVPEVDAEPSDHRRDAVRYLLPFPPDQAAALGQRWGTWTLTRGRRRGWDSPWPEWRWFRGEASPGCRDRIADIVAGLPANVYGLRAEEGGLAVYLRESGEVSTVQQVADALRALVTH